MRSNIQTQLELKIVILKYNIYNYILQNENLKFRRKGEGREHNGFMNCSIKFQNSRWYHSDSLKMPINILSTIISGLVLLLECEYSVIRDMNDGTDLSKLS